MLLSFVCLFAFCWQWCRDIFVVVLFVFVKLVLNTNISVHKCSGTVCYAFHSILSFASLPSVFRGKTLTLVITRKMSDHFFIIPAMLIGTFDFYHFIPLSVTLTLPGLTRSTRNKTYWLRFLAHFSSDRDEILCSASDELIQADYVETIFE